jgi:two-component system LytT family response regulator
MKDKIKAVIVDDIDNMRLQLKKLLSKFDQIQLVGEATDIDQATSIIDKQRPDLLFLDINLNGLSELNLIKSVGYQPMVVFIASNIDFAINAFELNAVDYLLKPFSLERMKKAIDKVVNKWKHFSIEEDISSKFSAEHIILLSFDDKMSFVRVKEINYIEAYGNYTKVNLNDGKLSITYNSIKNWQTTLPEELFIQIHRSTIVNISNIAKIEKCVNDTGRIYLNGIIKPFEISRNFFFQIKKKYKI